MHQRLGRQHNARSILFTLDFDELDLAAGEGNWALIGQRVADAARALERAGADFIMITSVTGHAVFEKVQGAVGVQMLHIADALKNKLPAGAQVGLLGTRFTLTMPHLIGPLEKRLGLEVLVPPEQDREVLQRIISNELQHGRVSPGSQILVREMAVALNARGAEAVLLGCTELPLLMAASDYPVRALDLVQLHVEAAAERSLR